MYTFIAKIKEHYFEVPKQNLKLKNSGFLFSRDQLREEKKFFGPKNSACFLN
jgi:hypothetical protein